MLPQVINPSSSSKVSLQTPDRPLLALLHLYRIWDYLYSILISSLPPLHFLFCLSHPGIRPLLIFSIQKPLFFPQFYLFLPSRQVMGRWEFVSKPLVFADGSRFKNTENERLSFFFVTASFVLISVCLSHTPSVPKWTYMCFFQKWTLNLFTPQDCECS